MTRRSPAGPDKVAEFLARGGLARRGLARPDQLADYIGVSEKTLENWRCQETGPPFIRINGRLIRYDLDAVDAWLADRVVTTY